MVDVEVKAPNKVLKKSNDVGEVGEPPAKDTSKDAQEYHVDGDPEWMSRLDEFTYKVKTKEGVFILEDAPNKRLTSATKRCTNPQSGKVDTGALELEFISVSLVDPKKGAIELDELRGSTIYRLKSVVYKMYDMPSFLQALRI